MPPLLGAATAGAFATIMVRAIEPFSVSLGGSTYSDASVGILIAFILIVCGPAMVVYLLGATAVLIKIRRRWLWIVIGCASSVLMVGQVWGLPGAVKEFPGTWWLVVLPCVSLYLGAVGFYMAFAGSRGRLPAEGP